MFFLLHRVFPAGLPARDVRQSLKRTEVVKEDRVDETEVFEQELKNKGDSLRRVPADENPVMKEMDERADVKVCRGLKLCTANPSKLIEKNFLDSRNMLSNQENFIEFIFLKARKMNSMKKFLIPSARKFDLK